MHDETHGTIMIISHQERILNIADEIIVVVEGRVAPDKLALTSRLI